MVLDYNETKGGVDNPDKVTATYSCRRMTACWPLVIFFNITDVSAYNAFVIWSEINKDWNSGKFSRRRIFLEQLGYAVVKPHIERRRRLPRASTAAATFMKDIQMETHTPNSSSGSNCRQETGRVPGLSQQKWLQDQQHMREMQEIHLKEHARTLCTSCAHQCRQCLGCALWWPKGRIICSSYSVYAVRILPNSLWWRIHVHIQSTYSSIEQSLTQCSNLLFIMFSCK